MLFFVNNRRYSLLPTAGECACSARVRARDESEGEQAAPLLYMSAGPCVRRGHLNQKAWLIFWYISQESNHLREKEVRRLNEARDNPGFQRRLEEKRGGAYVSGGGGATERLVTPPGLCTGKFSY